MREAYVVFALLVAAMLLLGCPGGQPAASEQGTGAQTSEPGTQGGQPQGTPQTPGGQPSGTTPQTTPQSNGSQGGSTPNGGSQGVNPTDLLGMGMAQLAQLGTPIKCTVTVTDREETMTATMYLKGQNIRYETPVSTGAGAIENVVTILKGKTAYTGMGQMMGTIGGDSQCDWISIDTSEVAAQGDVETYQNQGGLTPEELEQLPPASFSCNPDAFGDEKFDTPGKVCSMDELLGELMSGSGLGSMTGTGSNPCASIADPDDRAECEAYLGV